MSQRKVPFDGSARLSEQRPQLLSVQVPIPLSDRLDALIDRLDQLGAGRVSRKELVAALLHAAPTDAANLAEMLRRYRTALVRDTLIRDLASSDVIELPIHRPGPRTRAST